MLKRSVKPVALVLLVLCSVEGDEEGKLPVGLKIPKLPAPRVAMDTINTMNRLAPPNPSPWPNAFSVSFLTNLTEGEWNLEGVRPLHAIKGTLWYDSAHGQRVYHGPGSRECNRFYSTEGNCTLVFNTDGMYAVVPDQQRCCLDMPELRVPPADWTLTPHKFVGTQRIHGRMCHGFSYAPGSLQGLQGKFHEYWQDVKTHLPCMFTFPGEDRMAWVFEANTMNVAAQDARMFVVPAKCHEACSPQRQSDESASTQAEAAALWQAMRTEEEGALSQLIDEVLQGLTPEQQARLEEQAKRIGMAENAAVHEEIMQ